MKIRKITGALLAASVLLSGCRAKPVPDSRTTANTTAGTTAETTDTAEQTTKQSETTTTPEPERFTFNPHVYSPTLGTEIPQDHWDSFYNLCDALRAGGDTFACSSQEAYDFSMDSCVLAHLLPPSCMKISGESNDQTKPYENGVGRIYYNIPPEEYVKRQAEFEEKVVDVLNTCLEPDDDDFEKCLKLYRYMEMNYIYEDFPQGCGDGAYYYTFMTHKGVCDEISGVYMYLLLQVGVDVLEVGCTVPTMAHAWNYVIIDGHGYHIDPTWSLMPDHEIDASLSLEYFMMTDEHRIGDGCDLDELTVDLLPKYWLSNSTLKLPETDDRFYAKDYSKLDSLDEENKIMHYTDMYGNSFELYYG